MRAVALRIGLVVALAVFRTPLERAWQSWSGSRSLNAPDNSQAHPAQGQLPPADRKIYQALGQLPAIERPGQVQSHETATAARYRGHFFFQTEVNGVPVPMMFDTGASFVSLRAEDAERAGIDLSTLNYSVRLSSANGIVAVAPVVIREMKVGGIILTNVRGTVGKPGAQRENLLGQSFTTRMAGFSTEGNTLTIRGN